MSRSRARPSSRADQKPELPASAAIDWVTQLRPLINGGTREMRFDNGDLIYSQGEKADAVFFLIKGRVKLSVLSKAYKEAILGVLNAGDFFGEGCLAGQPVRVGTATAESAVVLIRVARASLVKALHDQHPLSEMFLVQLLARNIAFEEDICDQLFNHSEKRLARALLKLARFGRETEGASGHTIRPRVSQEALAEMIGSTRSRVNFFMNKFRRLGLIEYNGEFRVHPELLTDVVLGE